MGSDYYHEEQQNSSQQLASAILANERLTKENTKLELLIETLRDKLADAQGREGTKDAEIERLKRELDETCHVIIEAAGNWPVERDWCHCEACSAVAKRMDDAGWCDHSKNRWWEDVRGDAE